MTNTELLELTSLFIQKLKDDVMYWQEKALAASELNDNSACQQALSAQKDAIDRLIKLTETATNKFVK
jgi:hypothetical protein